MLKWPSAVSLFLFYTYILSLGHLSVKDLDSNHKPTPKFTSNPEFATRLNW